MCSRAMILPVLGLLACDALQGPSATVTVDVDLQGYDLTQEQTATLQQPPLCGIEITTAPDADDARDEALAGDLWLRGTHARAVLLRVHSAELGEGPDDASRGLLPAPVEPGEGYEMICAGQRYKIQVLDVDNQAGSAQLQIEPVAGGP
ncbi:MAG: hypothetical protein ABIJ09_05520 [Pseudomonadota bacterium]